MYNHKTMTILTESTKPSVTADLLVSSIALFLGNEFWTFINASLRRQRIDGIVFDVTSHSVTRP